MIFQKKPKKRKNTGLWLALLLGVGLFSFGFTQSSAPAEFPIGEIISIEPGAGVRKIAASLESGGYIRSAQWFMVLLHMRSSSGFVVSGDYIFDQPTSAFVVVDRLSRGDYGPTQVTLTVPEGVTATQIGALVEQKVPAFDVATFNALVEGKEGYLFPDTYRIFPSVKPEQLVELLESTFWEKVTPVFVDNEVPEEEWADIINMASIVEREAFGNDYREHQIVAGIMKHRMEIDMPLQVDATLHYLLGKTSSQLTLEDLRVDSPYNTYVNKGLPPAPISNPGLLAIRSVIESIKTDYLFYLHDSSGNIWYAVTHDEHVANKRRYLR